MKPEMRYHTKNIIKQKRNPLGIQSSPKTKMSREDEEIVACLHKVKREMDMVNISFEYATDPILIDSFIYEQKALQMKYQYLIKQVKERGLLAEGFEEIS